MNCKNCEHEENRHRLYNPQYDESGNVKDWKIEWGTKCHIDDCDCEKFEPQDVKFIIADKCPYFEGHKVDYAIDWGDEIEVYCLTCERAIRIKKEFEP